MVVASRRTWRACLRLLTLVATCSPLAFAERPPVPRPAGDRQGADLHSLAQRAGTIIAGRVVQVRPGTHPAYPRVGVTLVTLRVSEAFKGAAPGDFTFMQIGHAGGTPPPMGRANFLLLPDLPSYRVGEEVLLFLYPPSEAGLTSPVDGARGKWSLERNRATGQLQVMGMTLGATRGQETGAARTAYPAVRASLRRMIGSGAAKRVGTASQSVVGER